MICNDVEASLDDNVVMYKYASVGVSAAVLTIYRLDPPEAHNGHAIISSFGPHFRLPFSESLAWASFQRRHSEFYFQGPDIGTMDEVSGAIARDGTYSHGITSCRIAVIVEPRLDRLSIDVSGNLAEQRQAVDGWPRPKPRSKFAIGVSLLLSRSAALFRTEMNPQEHIDRYLQYHPDAPAMQGRAEP